MPGGKRQKTEAFPRIQLWKSNLGFKKKKQAFGHFFQSLSQNQPGFGKGSIFKKCLQVTYVFTKQEGQWARHQF
jgi:hypothetical protein